MATTKTIQPTGATITLPEFTDQPDIRPVVTDIGNITDATNALSGQIGELSSPTIIADCDGITQTGVYMTSNTTQNSPASWCIMQVIVYSSTIQIQIAIQTSVDGNMWIRRKDSTWGSWKKVTVA